MNIRRSMVSLGGIWAGLAATMGGCGETAGSTACAVDGDCNPGRTCAAQQCITPPTAAPPGVPGPDAGSELMCTAAGCASPPPNICSDAKTLRAHATQGSCASGLCTYAPFDMTCPNGCQDGKCSGNDPCQDVTCVAPPASECSGSHTLKTYSPAGTCTGGACSYTSMTTPCMNGCKGGACAGEPCAGVTCVRPPAPSCATGTTVRSYGSTGTCAAGSCSYAPLDTPCEAVQYGNAICTAGACGFTCSSGYVRSGTTCVPAHDVWTKAAQMAGERQGFPAVTGSDGRIYAIGGKWPSDDVGAVEAYTPSTNTWSAGVSLLLPRIFHAAVLGNDGRIFVVGGRHGGVSPTTWVLATSVEVYTPGAGAWTTVADLPTPRQSAAAAVGADGRIYVIGGSTAVWGSAAATSATVEVYTPSTNTWATAASLLTPRAALTAATGPDGRIYAIGGTRCSPDCGGPALATVEVYTPSSNSWASAASMASPRAGFATAVGSDGRIYALGGSSSGSGAFVDVWASSEVYTPSTNAWASVASMAGSRDHHGAAAAGGHLYAIGGSGKGTSVEMYTP